MKSSPNQDTTGSEGQKMFRGGGGGDHPTQGPFMQGVPPKFQFLQNLKTPCIKSTPFFKETFKQKVPK